VVLDGDLRAPEHDAIERDGEAARLGVGIGLGQPLHDVGEVERIGAGADEPRLEARETHAAESDVEQDDGGKEQPRVQAVELDEGLRALALGHPESLEGDVPGEEVEVDILDGHRPPGELGDARDHDPAHDLGQRPEERAADHHEQGGDDQQQGAPPAHGFLRRVGNSTPGPGPTTA
jgi:hypothetical protein